MNLSANARSPPYQPQYVSPSLGPTTAPSWKEQPSSAGNTFRPPPPFTLTSSAVHHSSLSNNSNTATTIPPPPLVMMMGEQPFSAPLPRSLQQQLQQQGGGTPPTHPTSTTTTAMVPVMRSSPSLDPSRLKTELCRSWEGSGSCHFRNCNFAHGPEELRPTPPLTTNSNNGGNNSNNSSGGFMRAATSPYPQQQQPSMEHLLELMHVEVAADRQQLVAQQDANKALEAALKKEQGRRQRSVSLSESLERTIVRLTEALDQRTRIIAKLVDDPSSDIALENMVGQLVD